MPDDDERERKVQKFLAKKYEPYIEFAKKLLFEKVNNVVISNRLTTEPCVVVADTYGHSSFMDKIQRAQMFAGANQDNPLQDFKKILEINPHHRVNQIILERINVLLFIFSNKKQLKRLRNLWNYYMRLLPSIQDLRPRTQMSLLRDFIKFILRLWE
jgi:HSP90 family molecular chaperone